MDAGDDTDQPPSPVEESSRTSHAVIEIADETKRLTEGEIDSLEARLLRALEHQAPGASHDIRVLIVGDQRMGEVHERHSGDPSTTDVLTFDLRDEATGPLDVDLIVCLDEAERAARERGHTPLDELTLYALHGALHCLGYDDHDDASRDRMHEREDEILRAIGLGAIYSGAKQ
jgi:probable rRNA maturation factor